jgi:cytochrome P450
VWIIARRAIEDDVIGGHHIRRGTTVVIPIHHIHHDPRWWRDPETFDPGRFLQGADRPHSAASAVRRRSTQLHRAELRAMRRWL